MLTAALSCQSSFGDDLTSGLSLFAGPITSNEGVLHGRGYLIGGDAQVVIGGEWSLDPYVTVSRERVQFVPFGPYIYHSPLLNASTGVQLRRWFWQTYVGVQWFYHAREYALGQASVQSGGLNFGSGFGLVTGWQATDHWYVEAAVNGLHSPGSDSGKCKISYFGGFTVGVIETVCDSNGDALGHRRDLSVRLGYRW